MKTPANLSTTLARPRARSFARGLGLLSLVSGLSAADVPPPENANAPTGDTVRLSEFTVSSTADNSYMPAESTSGSRVAVKIKDLPYAVNVVTSEFLQDFNIFDITEELAFTSSVNGLDQGGNFNVRGFSGNVTLRNGFSRLGNFDRESADRIEFIKGPAAAIYGQTAPGGIVNIITKQPRTKPYERVFVSGGSYDTTREEIESSGPIPIGSGTPKLFYIANASYFHRTYEGQAQGTRTRTAYFDLLYKFSDTTRLSFDFDYNWQHNVVVALPEQVDPANAKRFLGLANSIEKLWYANPTDWNERAVFNYEAFFEHRFNDIFSMRAAGNIYRSPRFSYSSGGLSAYNPATRTLTRSQKPTYGFLQGDGQSAAVDFVASYNIGSTRNKTLLTTDYFNNVGKRPSFTARNNIGPATVSVDGPTYLPVIPFSNTDYVASRFAWDYARTLGNFLRHQIWAFHDRLVAVAGVRYDHVQLFKHDDLAVYPASDPRAGQHVADARVAAHNFSTMAGFNYSITPDLVFYASRSESFVPAQPNALDLTKTPVPVVPNQTGLGYEAGFKIDALDHRLSFTTDVYEITLHHVQISEINPADPLGPLIVTFDGGQKSRGFEFDGNWRVTNELQAILAYSYTWSRATERGVDQDVMSRQFLRIPYHQIGGALRYNFKNGLSPYLSMRYLSAAYVDTSNTAPDTTTKVIYVGNNDGRRLIQSPAYAVWNLGVSYKFKTEGPLTHNLNFTIKNLFDKFYVQPNRNVGDRFGVYGSYDIRY